MGKKEITGIRDLMEAKTAKGVADTVNTANTLNDVREICRQIHEQASEGHYSLVYDGEINKFIISNLEKLGYKVNEMTNQDKNTLIIKWE